MTKGFKKFNEIMLILEKENEGDTGYNISESLDFINRLNILII